MVTSKKGGSGDMLGKGVVTSEGGGLMVRSKGGGDEWSEVKEEGSGQKQGRGGSGQKQGRGREWS